MWICKDYDFYRGLCPALQNGRYCTSKFPCSNKISLEEYSIGRAEFLKAKRLIKSCGYEVIKKDY